MKTIYRAWFKSIVYIAKRVAAVSIVVYAISCLTFHTPDLGEAVGIIIAAILVYEN
jgi:hypothetical protein